MKHPGFLISLSSRLVVIMLVMAAAAPLLSGCWGRRELEDIASLALLGLDPAVSESVEPQPAGETRLAVTMGIVVPRALTGPGGAQIGGNPTPSAASMTVLRTTAPNLAVATKVVEESLDRELRSTHLQAIFVGEHLAKEGLEAVLDMVLRYRNLRHTIPILVVEGTAREAIDLFSPAAEASPWTYVRKMIDLDINRRVSTQLHVHDLLTSKSSLSKDAVLPLIRPREELQRQDPASNRSVAVAGGAVFRDARMVGKMDTTDALHALMVRGGPLKGLGSYVVTGEPVGAGSQGDPGAAPQGLVNVEWESAASHRSVSLSGGGVHIRVSLELEGELVELPGFIDLTTIEGMRNLEHQVSDGIRLRVEDVIRKAQTEWDGADIFFFGDRARMRFTTWSEWVRFSWPERFKTATVQVDVRAHLRRPGLTLRNTWNLEPGSDQ